MKRQFVTKTDIDRIVEEGRTVLEVDATTTVTDLALEHARQRGVTVRQAVPDATPHPTGSPPAVGTDDLPRLRGAVRSAVIGRLGEVLPASTRALDRVLGE